ncbi:hypothetical protein GBF38_006952 [Nibea albiflora]|uniref:Uncharacterized protein n=1 Tax=Nibea albiflora TaxID=240163 RepID=A0ACB7EHS8_NIBAL|nr:hypothetical protein GBF38_006952 [Nibea albiflora]
MADLWRNTPCVAKLDSWNTESLQLRQCSTKGKGSLKARKHLYLHSATMVTNSCTGTECPGWLFAQNRIADAEEM